MPKFTMSFDMDNAAFDPDNPHKEAARILKVATEKVNTGVDYSALLDKNGNRVGEFDINYDDD